MAIITPRFLTPISLLKDNFGSFPAGEYWWTGVIDRSLAPTFGELVTIYVNYNGWTGTILEGHTFDIWLANLTVGQTQHAHLPLAQGEPTAGFSLGEGSQFVNATLLYSHQMVQDTIEAIRYSFNVADVLGGSVPPKWGVIVHNQGPIQVDANGVEEGRGDEYWCDIQGIQVESV